MKRRPRRALLALVVAGLLTAGCAGDGGGTETGGAGSTVTGIERDPAPDVSTVALPDAAAAGRPFRTVAGDGSLLLVYFGYTSCPDVCPTTLTDLRTARRRLGDAAGRVDLAMVTIDPARDTGEVLTRYVRSFVPGAHALRSDDPAALRAAADAFGADYSVSPGPSGRPEVVHTGNLYVVDDTGHLVLQWPFGTAAGDMAADLALLLGRTGS
ncbi:MAG TPA: SCO family protein [Acidimicrobiales bacterium]|nr:SCO family protein [Acidimicrobiales bacterium]